MVKEEKYDLWWENVLYNNLAEEPVSVVDVPDLFWAEVDYVQDYERIMEYVRTKDVSSKLDKRFMPIVERCLRSRRIRKGRPRGFRGVLPNSLVEPV